MGRILHVIPYFVPAYGFGGPVKVCLDLAATQVRAGHRVTVLTTDALDAETRVPALHEIVEGIEVVRLRNVSTRASKRYNLFLPRGLGAWLDARLQEFDVVHLHDYFTSLNVMSARRCRVRGIPYVIQPHGVAAPPSDQRLYAVKWLFGEIWGRELLRGARRILAVSEIERARLDGYLPDCRDRIVVVPNGLRVAPQGLVRDRVFLGWSDEDKVVLTLGRLHETKGFDRLIRAFRVLVDRDASYRLLIAGSDNGAQAGLEALVAALGLRDHVRFLGLVLDEQKERAFVAADAFALLSRYESFSLAVLEALHHGLPVCLTESVGIAAALAPFHCAVIARTPDDATRTADDLARLVARRYELGASARTAAQHFGLDAATRLVEAAYGLDEDARARVPAC